MRLILFVQFCLYLIAPSAALAAGAAADAGARDVRAVQAVITQYQPTTEITGEVAARISSDLSFRTSGRVTGPLVDVGLHVKQGDVLARIDDTEQRADVEIARARLQAAAAEQVQKQLTFDRNQILLKSHTISQAAFDQAREELIVAQGAEETARAALATAEDALSYTELKADADGVVTARSIESGQVVSAAQTTVSLAHDGQRDAVFDVFEAFFLEGAPSDYVRVAPLEGPGQVRAKIREISPALDTKSGTIRVKVTLPDDAQWLLGTAVKGSFQSTPRSGAVIPWSALTSAGGEPGLWVIDAATRKVSLRPVGVGLYRTGQVVVASGLKPHELVVTEGGQFLHDGQAVNWELAE